MPVLRTGQRHTLRARQSSPLAPRNHGVQERQSTGGRARESSFAAKVMQLLSDHHKANDDAMASGALEVPETPQVRRFTIPHRSSPENQVRHQGSSNDLASGSLRIVEPPTSRSSRTRADLETARNSRSTNTRVEVRVCIPGRPDERHVAEDTPLQSSPPPLRSASSAASRPHDSGFFSDINEPDRDPVVARRNFNGPSMRDLRSDRSYDAEAEHYSTLTAVEKLKREVKLAREPHTEPDGRIARINIGEGTELETMLLDEIAARLFSNKDWAWSFYYLLGNKLYDEQTCITATMRREFQGIPPRRRKVDNRIIACEYCVEEKLPCVRLFVDEKGDRRLSIVELPREYQRRYCHKKDIGYFIRGLT
ncbi:hypothetical protein C7974DRAFT_55007 [Boeremia exigua]|uniref:uncharacterized protein n=1 Tax=Boeremia exigua TaxID=749465 RepID=UPI001E8EA8FC|nr:uncharacterized protein C7974DRAFT_55007 [Boeremia exigua]KAH6614847.1 hypothetical protein C7974DRAFT_55007 [Boeremia exigua]